MKRLPDPNPPGGGGGGDGPGSGGGSGGGDSGPSVSTDQRNDQAPGGPGTPTKPEPSEPTYASTQITVSLLPVDISFEKVGDNWEIEDNKDKDGDWMPGKGKRMFVDAKTPDETAMRNTAYVKVKSLPPDWKIRLQAFDVDDPTTDDLDPDHVIDSNDTASIKRGSDNRGYDIVGQQPPHFVSSGDVTVDCTVDAKGVAKLANGELPKLQMTDHPGDNVRVAIIFLKPNGTQMDGQDLSVLQVTDSTQPGYVKPGDESAQGFSGGLSGMLTVWRKLNIEIDSMTAIPTSGSEKNFEQGTVQTVANGPISGQSTVTVNLLLAGTADRYEKGLLTVGGTSYPVISNTDHPTNFTAGDQVVVDGTVPTSAINDPFVIIDDDDKYLAQIGLPAPLPRNQYHAEIIEGIRSKYAPAYIQVEDANALGWNPNQTIPFKLNQEYTLTGGGFNGAKDITDKDAFWAFTVTFGYQDETGHDGDPYAEEFLLGGGLTTSIGNRHHYGYAAIFMEQIREDDRAIGDLTGLPPSHFNPANQQALRDSYRNLMLGVVAHEIGYSTGAQLESQDHAEGGLMRFGAGTINDADSDFEPATINRFRNAQQWTY